jgi:hypothetical protein
VAELISDLGGDVTKNNLVEEINKRLNVSEHDARALIVDAVNIGLVIVEHGEKRKQYHNVGPAYTPENGFE